MPLVDGLLLVRDKLEAVRSLCLTYVRQIPRLGLPAATILFAAEASTRRPLAPVARWCAPDQLKINPAGYQYPLHFRRVGSDRSVLRQLLVIEEYRPVARLRHVRLIVDCGANIGVSAYYLLHRYPAAHLIAVEPDPENCRLCERNLAPFGGRARVIQAAVWSANAMLRIDPSSWALGAWALRVEPWVDGDVEGLTLEQILRRAGERGPIDLLKLDIEGAETDIFRAAPRWLDITRNIAVELHDEAAEAALTRALADYDYERRRVDELTLVYGLRRSLKHRTPLDAASPVSSSG